MVLQNLLIGFEKKKKMFDQTLLFIRSRATILALSTDIAIAAAKLKQKYRKSSNKFSLANGIHLATAQKQQTVFITTDTDFVNVENVLLL